ncbi:MAG: hypothetical protein ABIY55_11990 [Kofleriaceae bacterium]
MVPSFETVNASSRSASVVYASRPANSAVIQRVARPSELPRPVTTRPAASSHAVVGETGARPSGWRQSSISRGG